MPWPSDQDYNEAIQNPGAAFSDQELRLGQVELNAMGFPKARSGNFATVYKVVINNTAYAVRCFRYDMPEYSLRYPAIASYLSQNTLPYMVSFRFMSEGIRVGPNWYPTVKMKWIDGESLVSYIEKNLSSQAKLRDLATGWAQMLSDLQHAKVAHGDLQHGNVLVVQGKLRLVDYDGMYVPGLEGSRGLELGHRNYQHPQRTELDFGPHLDNFSAWLIYVSLVAVASQPALWNQLKAGDECLLFRRKDFDEPDQSDAFRLLRKVQCQHVRKLADQIEQFLWLPPDQVPILMDDWIESATHSSTPITPTAGWIADYTHKSFVEGTDDFPRAEVGDQTWIQDHVPPKLDFNSFLNSTSVDRLIAFSNFLAAFLWCVRMSSGGNWTVVIAYWTAGTGIALGITLAFWRFRYLNDPVREVIRAAQANSNQASHEHETAKQIFEELKSRRFKRRESYLENFSKVQKQQGDLRSEQVKLINNAEGSLQAALKQISDRRRSATANEGAEKRRLSESIGGEISRFSHALSSLSDQKRDEILRLDADSGVRVRELSVQLQQAIERRNADFRTSLKNYQDQIVNSYLCKVLISGAQIPGIGPELKRRLATAGVVSAADIGTRSANVLGIGAKKLVTLYVWRNQIEAPIRAMNTPKSLPSHELARIEQRYEVRIRQLQQSLDQEKPRLASAKKDIEAQFVDREQILQQKKLHAESNLRQQAIEIEKKFSHLRDLLTNDEKSARLRCLETADDCRSRFRAADAPLTDELTQLKKHYKTSLEVLNREIELSARRVSETLWRRDRAKRTYSAYAFLNFRRYALRTLRKKS